MLFPLREHLNPCSNHHLCPSSLEYLVISCSCTVIHMGAMAMQGERPAFPSLTGGKGAVGGRSRKMMAGTVWLFQALMCFITCTIPLDINISKLAWWRGHCEMAASCQNHERWDLREGFAANARKRFMSKRGSVKACGREHSWDRCYPRCEGARHLKWSKNKQEALGHPALTCNDKVLTLHHVP